MASYYAGAVDGLHALLSALAKSTITALSCLHFPRRRRRVESCDADKFAPANGPARRYYGAFLVQSHIAAIAG